ncbi:hypothetical protein J2785_005436 [Burkholderia ambifaria]|nr:hypothetical protein [Burkholderia ambifaria]MDR6502256.1 hypothetical protein [Burkholderia ambifaria]
MTTTLRLVPLALAVALIAGCQAPMTPATVPESAAAAADAACVVDATGFTHIYQRHCTASSGANQFIASYCTQAAQQNLCRQVQAAPNKTRTVQPDGRIRYDANLGIVVGTVGEKCVRLITSSATNGTVVTQFPETSGAPGTCQ